nr:SPOR domain-containing protein [uncultured Pseudogulbenkiania sp.]
MGNIDLKHSSRSSSSRRNLSGAARSGGGGLMAGIVIGLIVGVAVAIGLAMYLNRSATPFATATKSAPKPAAQVPEPTLLSPGSKIAELPVAPSSAPAIPATPPAPVAPPAAKPTAPAKSQDEQRFDFYKILPGQLDAVPGEGGKHAKGGEPSASAAVPKSYLQVGAFQNEDEADNLKARLAMLGVEASIQSVNLPDKGLVHRVRVGPFTRQEDLDRVRAQLKQDGLTGAVVKGGN